VDISRFRIVDFERLVTTMSVCLVRKLPMEHKNIVGKIQRKLRNIFASSFSAQKFPPGVEQIIERYDMMKNMAKPFTLSLSLSRARARSSSGSKRDI